MDPLRGVALKVAATFIFTIMGVLVKLVADEVPTGQIVFFRSLFGTFPILAVLIARREFPALLRTQRFGRHVSRTILGTSSMLLGFFALSLIPLPEATAIGYAMPLFAVIFAVLILKEVVRVYRWSAVVIGLVGVLVILWPHIEAARTAETHADMLRTAGVTIGLIAAVISALAMVTVRSLTDTEPAGTIVFYFSAGGAVIGLLSLPFGWVVPQMAWVWPSWSLTLILAAIGLIGGFAQILVTHSYRYAQASVIAPFEYTSLIWAVLFGWIVFGDRPTGSMLAGSAIVIAAGLFVIWRERQLGIERQKERQTGKTAT